MENCDNIDLDKLTGDILHLLSLTKFNPITIEFSCNYIVYIDSLPHNVTWDIRVKNELGEYITSEKFGYCDEDTSVATKKVVRDVIYMIYAEKHISVKKSYDLLQEIILKQTEEAEAKRRAS